MKKIPLLCAILLTAFASIAFGQKRVSVFIAPTGNGLGGFVSAALLENKVLVDITVDEKKADYIIVCSGVKGQNKWYDTVFGAEKDRNQGSMKLIRVRDKSVVWAAASKESSSEQAMKYQEIQAILH